MKVLHIVSGIDPKSGGPTRSVTGLCRSLPLAGVNVTLFVHSPTYDFMNPGLCRFIKGHGTSWRLACRETEQVIQEVKPDIIHLHGLWMPVNHFDLAVALRHDIPVILSPHGMRDPWALSVKRWKKWLAFKLYQERDLRNVTAFHATASFEESHIRAHGLLQPIFCVPNGVTLPSALPEWKLSTPRVALFLSRIHPGKGLLTLAEAWARIKPSGWRMKVIGPDSYGYKVEIIKRLQELGLRDAWNFVDALDDEAKWTAYRSADLLVHPSVSENFGITIAEGLYAGLPVIATKGTPWHELETAHCGWWIDIGVEPLAIALKQAMALTDAERAAMGANGRRLVEREYTWPAIAEKMKAVYERIVSRK